MNYIKIYNSIIKRSQKLDRIGYTEKHHINPKCMGGNNDKDNIVALTAREHFICHWLLFKEYKTKDLAFAWHCMSMDRDGKRYKSKSFEYAKIAWAKEMSEITRNRIVSKETRLKQSLARKGKATWNKGLTYSMAESKERKIYADNLKKCAVCDNSISFKMRNRAIYCSVVCSNIERDKWAVLDASKKPNRTSFKRGHIMSENTTNKISSTLTGLKRPRGACPHCGKEGALSLLKRWHFDNCKDIN